MAKNIYSYIQSLSEEEFYGELNIKFEKGIVVLCRKTETMKPSQTGDFSIKIIDTST